MERVLTAPAATAAAAAALKPPPPSPIRTNNKQFVVQCYTCLAHVRETLSLRSYNDVPEYTSIFVKGVTYCRERGFFPLENVTSTAGN
ncbi:hypothetical protein ANCDUO_00006 [Ancylostoma duodenale]|uniref:Uncharacterized protein n=1 Tax=Ancylostoma duodenale TaxID=51022 RepID=A0A0C2H6X0_9BILA|nr:hypothetical protein ANCDUO_00006 [Ancylostoma duodenale]